MASISINQSVAVRWVHPNGSEGEQVVRNFTNLIPACEFAVAMEKEGDVDLRLYPEYGRPLEIGEAKKIATEWESGAIPLDATEVSV